MTGPQDHEKVPIVRRPRAGHHFTSFRKLKTEARRLRSLYEFANHAFGLKATPAMAANVQDHVWPIEELVDKALAKVAA
jgi:hypothetical protein